MVEGAMIIYYSIIKIHEISDCKILCCLIILLGVI